jgi:hypothetical protein
MWFGSRKGASRSESERRLDCRARPSVRPSTIHGRPCPRPRTSLLSPTTSPMAHFSTFIGRDDPPTGHIWEHSDSVDPRREGARARGPYPSMDGRRQRGCERARVGHCGRRRRSGVLCQTRHVQAARNVRQSVSKYVFSHSPEYDALTGTGRQTSISHRLKSRRRGKSSFSLCAYDDDHVGRSTAGASSKSKFESTLSPSRGRKRSRSTTTSNSILGPLPFRSQARRFQPNRTFRRPRPQPSSVPCIHGNTTKSSLQIRFNRCSRCSLPTHRRHSRKVRKGLFRSTCRTRLRYMKPKGWVCPSLRVIWKRKKQSGWKRRGERLSRSRKSGEVF